MKFDLNEVPMGFGMMLMRNANAMDYYASLTDLEREAVLRECESIRSKDEMRAYVDGLGKK